MGFPILIGYVLVFIGCAVLAVLEYAVALLASLLIFACFDAFANRHQPSPLREKLWRNYRTGVWRLRTLWIFVRIVLAPALLLYAFWWNPLPVASSSKSHPSFAKVVGVASPKSAHVLNSSDEGTLDRIYWMHFTIDPKDVARPIPKGNGDNSVGVSVSTVTAKQMDFHALNPPAWWRPQDLGGTWRKYEKDSVNPSEHLCLLVNAAKNDVYAYRSVAFN